jgi:hypothetical protein
MIDDSRPSPATQADHGRSGAGASSLAGVHDTPHHHGAHHHHGPVDGGPPVLDIGGDVGALVATMADDTVGTELFLRPADAPRSTVHTGVWPRRLGSDTVTVAVFPELTEGMYHVLGEDGGELRPVEVRGGAVTTIDLR